MGANETASDAAPALAVMCDVSVAVIDTLEASMPVVPSFVTYALTSVPILFVVSTPEPAPAMPAPGLPPATAIDAATTVESIVAWSVALTVSAPCASTLVFERYARTSAACFVSSSLKPMRFCASEAPIATPTVEPPATLAATIVAVTCESSVAVTDTAPALSTSESAMNAFVDVRITFVASAPAPDSAMPVWPKLAASEAATAVAVIVASSVAASVTPPSVVCSACAFEIDAST